MHGDVRPAPDEKRLRGNIKRCANASKSHGGGAFQTKPVVQVIGEVCVVTEVMKRLTENIKMLVLKADPELYWQAIRRMKRHGSGGFTGGGALVAHPRGGPRRRRRLRKHTR